MDWVKILDPIMAWIKKYRYPVMIVLDGLIIMCLPVKQLYNVSEVPDEQAVPVQRPDVQTSLEEMLSQIQGAGKVKVLLTVARGEETLYQTDEDHNTGADTSSIRVETVIVGSDTRQEYGLIRQVIGPIYQGALVICQGADQAGVRLAVVDAVSSVTGLGADHISVLKMK